MKCDKGRDIKTKINLIYYFLIFSSLFLNVFSYIDRGNEFSDDDEEQDFSSNEDNDDGLSGYASKRNYSSKRDNYRKLGRNENDVEIEENLGGAQGDSDSDYEVKEKQGSRVNKISRVSFLISCTFNNYFLIFSFFFLL
jgi:hypothetical protein